MKLNSPICASDAEMVSADPTGRFSAMTRKKPIADLPTRMMNSVPSTCHGWVSRIVGLNSMPTDTKNSTANASRNGRLSCAARLRELAFAEDHAGKERAERQADAEQIRGARRNAERDGQHRQPEQLAAAGVRGEMQNPRNDPPPDHQHEADEGRELHHRDAQGCPRC